MASQIYVNLPVKNLDKSKDFFAKLGFSFNQQFSDDKAACLVIGENIYAMLLTESYFKTFTQKPVSDAKKSTEVLLAIDAESREKVDDLVQKAVRAGGQPYREPQDHGWMYERCFADLDGHQWEVIYMDKNALPQA